MKFITEEYEEIITEGSPSAKLKSRILYITFTGGEGNISDDGVITHGMVMIDKKDKTISAELSDLNISARDLALDGGWPLEIDVKTISKTKTNTVNFKFDKMKRNAHFKEDIDLVEYKAPNGWKIILFND